MSLSPEAIRDRLAALRAALREAGVDGLLVRSADAHLDEYVPPEDSTRQWVSGFTGSMGEVCVLDDAAVLAVDGRYWTQAEAQVEGTGLDVLRVPLSTTIDQALLAKVRELAIARPATGPGRGPLRLGFEVARMTPAEVDTWRRGLGDHAELVPLAPSPVERLRGPLPAPTTPVRVRAVDEATLGVTADARRAALARELAVLGVDALLVQRLDEIAYLTNLRGNELPYQATFRAELLATPDALWLAVPPAHVPEAVRAARPGVRFVSPSTAPGGGLAAALAELTPRAGAARTRVGYDPQHNTEAARLWLGDCGVDAVPVTSPIGPMKAKKTAAELVVMKAAFAKADAVVSGAAAWLSGAVLAGQRVSELDFAREVERRFLASGATGLSFRVISAAGANGAIIHYSDPSSDVVITRGEVVLLDTGAYYAEGFATDLTRTFLVGAPDDRGTEAERARYTHVLKAAIAGMTAVFPEAAKGYQLDAITRAPLWAAGLDYNHGTGHGVGINVHEFPPRIGPLSTARVEVGHVFSIEPGVYLPGVGGVRIENLCTVEPAPGRPGFLRVVPLTFSPLDARLIEASMLEPKERAFLAAHDPATARAIG